MTRATSTPDRARLAGIVIALLAAAALLAVGASGLLGRAAGPEAEVVTALKRLEAQGVRLTVPGAREPLVSRALHFGRISVLRAQEGGRAEAVATLDFDGQLGATHVSSLGLERIPFVQREGVWVPAGPAAPLLVDALGLLEARRQALEAADGAALAPLLERGEAAAAQETARLAPLHERRLAVEAWFLRHERDEVLVGERFHLSGRAPGGERVEERGERPLRLVRCGEGLCISSALR